MLKFKPVLVIPKNSKDEKRNQLWINPESLDNN